MNVKPLQGFLIIVFFGLIFSGAFYTYDQQLNQRGVSYLHHNGENLFMVLGTDLLQFDQNGFIKRFDLKELGIQEVVGDIGFFANGDLLIRAKSEPLAISDNLAVYFRQSGHNVSKFEDARLLRCDLPSKTCTALALKKTFPRTFKTLILDNDEIILTDTENHHLLWFDVEGNEKAFIKSELKFPNGLSWMNGDVLVANTNKHMINRIGISDAGFAQQATWISTKIDIDQWNETGHRWPSQVLALDENYLVLVQNNAMKNGRVLLTAVDGKMITEFSVDGNEDFIAMAVFNGQVIVADYSAARVYRFNLTGELLGEYESAELSALLAARRATMQQLEYVLTAIKGLGLAIFCLIFIYALWQEHQHKKSLENKRDTL